MRPDSYKKIDDAIVNKLEGIFASDALIVRDRDLLGSYGEDEGSCEPSIPQAVAFPQSNEQVMALVRLCNEEKIPLTPRGGGTGVTGACIPLYGGVVVSLSRYNRILEVDEKNFCAVVEPGVVLEKLHEAVEEKGLFYPPDPNSLDSCCIGGNVATSAGGPRCVKYGITRDYVLKTVFVNPQGETLQFGGKYNKVATGYNLSRLMVGSEGTLGIITEITVRLIPKPPYSVDLLVPFKSFKQASEMVPDILKQDYNPAIMEFIDRAAISYSERFLNKKFAYSDESEAQLLIEIDGFDEGEVQHKLEKLGEYMLKQGALDVFVAEDKKNKENIWEMRRSLREALKHIGGKKRGEDVVVPRDKIPDLLLKAKSLKDRYGLDIVTYGHAGDGNVHINVVRNDAADDIWEKNSSQCVQKIFETAISLGGTISGEHGIGISKKPYLGMILSKGEIEAMKDIKRSWDKNMIMNPGKIFDIDI